MDTLRHRVLELCLHALRCYPAQAEYYVDCIGISRDLERIGDHAKQLAVPSFHALTTKE